MKNNRHQVTDVVCGMSGPKENFTFRLKHEGKTHYFCSQHCLEKFRASIGSGHHSRSSNNPQHLQPRVTYTCPMHPEIIQDRPGMCPECGMALVPAAAPKGSQAKSGHEANDKHAGHSTRAFFQKFWVSLAMTIPVVLYSELPERLFGWTAPQFPGSEFLPFVLGSIVFFYGGWVFIASAWREIVGRMPGMMTLIAMAVIAAYAFSVANTLTGRDHTLYWELTTLITVMLLGHWIEMRAVQGAQGALRELSKLLPDVAEKVTSYKSSILDPQSLVTVPVSALRSGDLVLVRPGGKLPADGVVVEGKSEVNESMITGESRPEEKTKDSKVIAGTINGSGSLIVKVTQVGEKTFLAGVMRLVADAQASKSKLQLLSDKAAFYLTFIALSVGGIAFVVWLLAADLTTAVERLVAVLVIACPHALGLAVPLVASISTTLAARSGLLVRQRLALEAARNIDIVLFDKTGTLTTGQYGVQQVLPIGDISESEVLKLAASVDAHSEHFIARAIVNSAKQRRISLIPVKDFAALPGRGVKGNVDNARIMVGGAALLEEMKISLPKSAAAKVDEAAGKGQTIIYVIKSKALIGAIALADLIREESRDAIAQLKRMGMKTAMITGDSEEVARWVAGELSIDEYFARVWPAQKTDRVKQLQERGLKVAMVGDGINDAPALTQADLGIAIGAGTNVAIESAGIILVRNDPRDIAKIVRLSRLTYRKMLQNLFWATGYNVAALPLAAGILANQGIVLQPAVAAILMSASTVIVAFNAVLLRRAKL